jgi:hypothetical protein
MRNKICSLLLILALVSGLFLSSCEKPDIYALVETILNDPGTYSFEADLSLEIRDSSNGAVPKDMTFEIKGRASGGNAEIDVALVRAGGEEFEIAAKVYKQQDMLCFELGELAKIISDLLGSTGMLEMPVKKLFDEMAGYEGDILYVELAGLDLNWFERYSDVISETFTIKSKVTYDRAPEVDIPEYEWVQGLNFFSIKNAVEKELLKYPHYRYVELQVILEAGENGGGWANILATRESGERQILDKFKLECDLSEALKNPEAAYTENILPMRYLMELLGEVVGWDDAKKAAYVLNGGNKIYYEGTIIDSRAYIPLNHFITRTDYIVNSVSVGEYIEFRIIRK